MTRRFNGVIEKAGLLAPGLHLSLLPLVYATRVVLRANNPDTVAGPRRHLTGLPFKETIPSNVSTIFKIIYIFITPKTLLFIQKFVN